MDNRTQSRTVSVLIPVRNRSRLLRELVESVWQQSFPFEQFEIIVSDNCSDDDTPETIKALQENSPCRFIAHRMSSNQGPAVSRNAAARLASGKYLAFTDSDCCVDSNWLARGIEAFRPEVGFVAGAVLNKPGQPVEFFSRLKPGVAKEHPTFPTENIFFRKSVFDELGGFDAQLSFRDVLNRPNECADSDLAWRIIEAGYDYVFNPLAIVYHEIERQTPLNWLLEPFRLFVVPALVRRHPALRRRLLTGGLFFYAGSIPYYFVAICFVVIWFRFGALAALALPGAYALIRIMRRVLMLRRPAYSLWQVGMLVLRQMVMTTGLLYGSIRFRRLVL